MDRKKYPIDLSSWEGVLRLWMCIIRIKAYLTILGHPIDTLISQAYLGWENFMGTNWVKESCLLGFSFYFLKWLWETFIISNGYNDIHSSSPTQGKCKTAFILGKIFEKKCTKEKGLCLVQILRFLWWHII